MLSRVADNLYWFGRHLQRAENTARLASVHGYLLLDAPRQAQAGWLPLVQIMGSEAEFTAKFGGEASEGNVMRFLLLEADYAGSLRNTVHSAREILRTIRECVPGEVWEHVNDLHYLLLEKSALLQETGEKSLARTQRQEMLQRILDGCLLIAGLLNANMSHDAGFQFLCLGTSLEQADMTTRIIDVRSSTDINAGAIKTSGIKPQATEDLAPFQSMQWLNVLRSLMAEPMFRRHMHHCVSGPTVLRFLLQDREFPRSVLFCVQMMASTLAKLPPNRRLERSLERLRALVADANIEYLLAGGLAGFIDEIQMGLGELHAGVSAAYFEP